MIPIKVRGIRERMRKIIAVLVLMFIRKPSFYFGSAVRQKISLVSRELSVDPQHFHALIGCRGVDKADRNRDLADEAPDGGVRAEGFRERRDLSPENPGQPEFL